MPDTEKTLATNQEATSEAVPKGTQDNSVELKKQIEAMEAKLRTVQSTKDREVSAATQRADALAAEIGALRNQIETMITDPTAKTEFQAKQLQAELERYKAKDMTEKQRRMFSERYKVPETVFDGIDDPRMMTTKALDWLREQADKAATVVEKPVAKPVPQPEPEADKVSLATAPSPDKTATSVSQLDKQILELRKIAQAGGSAGERARRDILKLELQRKKPKAVSAQV